MRRGLQRRGEDAQLAFSTLDMSQLLMFWLKVCAFKNIDCVVVTLLISQLPMSGLQSILPEKRPDMSLTAATFQLEIGP